MDPEDLKAILGTVRQIQADLDGVRHRLGPDGTGDDATRWIRAQLASISDNDLSMLAQKLKAAATGTVISPPI